MTHSVVDLDRSGSLRSVFRVAFPLIVSAGSFAVKLFCDRLMLAWYADRSIAAALSAGMTAFMLVSFFMGIASYANAFVAQYSGAERHDRTGLAVWQALLFSLAAGALIAAVGMFGGRLFELIGHRPELYKEEDAYFRVLMGGAVFNLLNAAIMCFWTGRNKTWTVVSVNVVAIAANIVFNWALIFGSAGTPYLDKSAFPFNHFGYALNWLSAAIGAPEMGIVGAGLATIGTDALSVLIFLVLLLRRRNRFEFGTWPRRLFDSELMRRMLRFGFGSGMQMFLDIGAFAVFNLLMGKYALTEGGGDVGAASGIAISVNGVAFVPMLGIGMAASILVGQGIGAKDIGFAKRSVRSARIMILTYMGIMCMLFLLAPERIVAVFAPTGEMNPATKSMAVAFVRIASMFCLSDGFFILYSNAIRGAGDTKYAMWVMGVMGWVFFALPCIVAFSFGMGPFVLWGIIVFYAVSSAILFYRRYRQGKWTTMRVIEEAPPSPAEFMRPSPSDSARLFAER